MSSASKCGLAALVMFAASAGASAIHGGTPPPPTHLDASTPPATVPAPDASTLRVCSDPNNMPFSSARQSGFENAIAAVVAKDLRRTLVYYWTPQRRGFIRNTLGAGVCDVVMGLPARYDRAWTTSPYYESTYVFVSRRDRKLGLGSLDDPRLRQFRIGIQITGDDYDNPPGAQALAARHLVDNVRGYTVYGDYSARDPQRGIIDAVARREVDAAIVWGPLAGYFARREPVAIEVTPVSPAIDRLSGRFTFEIAMGVRRSDRALHDALEQVLARRRVTIRNILRDYGVPLLDEGRT